MPKEKQKVEAEALTPGQKFKKSNLSMLLEVTDLSNSLTSEVVYVHARAVMAPKTKVVLTGEVIVQLF